MRVNHETQVQLDKVRTDGGTQPRAAINEDVVADFAERIQAGDKFPAIVVFYDGTDYWLADGFHRTLAHRASSRKRIVAEVHQGDRRAAILHSVGVNATHGLRRTNADKRRAVMTLLKDEEWGGWSDREIARRCRVSHPFVMKLRPEPASGNRYQTDPRKAQRGGSTYTIKTGGINADRPKRHREFYDNEATRKPRPDDLVDWPEPSPAEKKVRQEESHRFFQVFRALEALSGCDLTPEEFANECPETSAYRVADHLDAAVGWLTAFDKQWRKQWE